jgi:hypothetical protein
MYHSFSAPLSNPSVHIPLYWHRLALGFEASKAELADLVIAAGTKREEKRESRENAERKERNNTAHTKRSKLKPVHDSPCLSVVNPPPPPPPPPSIDENMNGVLDFEEFVAILTHKMEGQNRKDERVLAYTLLGQNGGGGGGGGGGDQSGRRGEEGGEGATGGGMTMCLIWT